MVTTLTSPDRGRDAHVAALGLTETARTRSYTDLDGAPPSNDETMPEGAAKDTVAAMGRIAGVLRQLDLPADVHLITKLGVAPTGGSNRLGVSIHCSTLEDMAACLAKLPDTTWDLDASYPHRDVSTDGVEIQVWPPKVTCLFTNSGDGANGCTHPPCVDAATDAHAGAA